MSTSLAVQDHMRRIDSRRRWIRKLTKARRQVGRLIGCALFQSARSAIRTTHQQAAE